ncbi:uncharacterized protein LOC129778904 [Toxorhynchites rutilus septentrionalis]|uniref:uncharacterized protein LOC129778904 n=1 Tax=Toxorhynchites rutilus septentrionalis TaxID=329112 RepID=UPI002478521D|nr:uncharacterized protein LOC129778904 [Toxorhynchites rutilus septentrionalis]
MQQLLLRIGLVLTLASGGLWALGDSGASLHRKKRIVFTYNSATGILCALSIPLIIPDRNIFVSYNFEMNYNMPTTAQDFTQGALQRIDTPEIAKTRSMDGANGTEPLFEENARSIRMWRTFTRKRAYRSLEINLNRMGLNGKRCILRAICEAAQDPLHEHNGIVGDLIQILLMPSHSENEHLPAEFYRAEEMGLRHDCSKYRRHCSKSILDVISTIY